MMKRTFKHIGKSIASAARPAISGLLAFIMLFGTIPAPAYAEMLDEAARAIALAQAESEEPAAGEPSEAAPAAETPAAEVSASDDTPAASAPAVDAAPTPAEGQPGASSAPAPDPERLLGDFAESDDLVYAAVQGDAPVSEDAVADAISAVDGVDAGKARTAASNLMSDESGIDMAAVPQGPQAQLKMTWITPDDEQNNNGDLLYLKPGSKRDPIGFRLSFAFNGDTAFDAGQVVIKLPRAMFKNRYGSFMGDLTLPIPQDPSTAATWNWRIMPDGYAIVNTRRLDAVTRGFMEFSISGIYPLDIVDQSVTDPYAASIELPGSSDVVKSNALQVQVDTYARADNAQTWATRPVIVNRSDSSVSKVARDKWPNEKQFVTISWHSNFKLDMNQPYTVSGSSAPGLAGNNKIEGVIRGMDADAKTHVYDPLKSSQNNESPVFVTHVIYPLSAFKGGRTYTFTNRAALKLTEIDPATPTDPQESYEMEASGTCSWSMYVGKFVGPRMSATILKYGNCNIPYHGDDYLSRDYYGRSVADLSVAENSSETYIHGLYPEAMLELLQDKPTELSYTIFSKAEMLPLTYQEPAQPSSGTDPEAVLGNYGKVPVTTRIDEDGLFISGEDLKRGADYTYSYLMFPKRPMMQKAVLQNINWVGQLEDPLKDGTIGYADDSSIVPPEMVVSVLIGRKWATYATVSWNNDRAHIAIEPGFNDVPSNAVSGQKLALPKDVEDIRITSTTKAAGMEAYVRVGVTLLPSETIKRIVSNCLMDPDFTVKVYNGAKLAVYDANEDAKKIRMSDSDMGFDLFETENEEEPPYDENIEVSANKHVSHSVDTNSRVIHLTYSANVSKRSGIGDMTRYEEAIAAGKMNPEENGVWYDLLPKGVVVDLSSIKLRDGDKIDAAYTLENYKGTGRTLLVVKADLTPVTTSFGDYYGDSISISFNATYGFSDAFAYGFSPHNVIAFQSGNDSLGTVLGSIGEPDDPRSANNAGTEGAFDGESDAVLDAMTDLDGDGKHGEGETNTFVYAGSTLRGVDGGDILQWATAGLSKTAMVNNDGVWDTGTDRPLDVFNGGFYSYRLSYANAETTDAKDLVFYDRLDGASAAGEISWRGTIAGVDVSMLESLGCSPVVYYTTEKNLELAGPDKSQNTNHTDLSKDGIWKQTSPADLEAMSFKERKKITGIAVDARMGKDGAEFMLPKMRSASVTISMVAPQGAEAESAIRDGSKAHNAMFLAYRTSVDFGVSWSPLEFQKSNRTAVGMKDYALNVTKAWDDDNDRDAKRPDSVNLQLQANGKDVTGKSAVLSGKNDWKGSFKGLSYTDEAGNKNVYTVREIDETGALDSYELVYSFDGKTIAARNRLIPERVTVFGVKTWSGDTEEERPSEIVVDLYKGDTKLDSQTVMPSSDGVWRYAFENLYKNENGKKIDYSVRESADSAPLYIHTVTGNDIHNEYHPYGDLTVTKDTLDVTDKVADKSFPVRIMLSQGGTPLAGPFDYIVTSNGAQMTAGTLGSGDVVWLKAGQKVVVKELPANAEFHVSETEPAGFHLEDASSVASGTIQANKNNAASLVSRYATSGVAEFDISKRLTGKEMTRKQFGFELRFGANIVARGWNERPQDAPEINEQGDVVSEAKVAMPVLSFSGNDHGKTFTYTLLEADSGRPGYACDDSTFEVTIKPMDNGDGTMRVDISYASRDGGILTENTTPLFENVYSARVSTALGVRKELKGGKLAAGQFTFEYGLVNTDETGSTVYAPLGTAKNNVDGLVSLPVEYTHLDDGKTFLYAIHEVPGNDKDITYDPHYALVRVSVSDLGNGKLAVDMEHDGFEVPCFVCSGASTPDSPCPACGVEHKLIAGQDKLLFVNRYSDGGLTVKKTLDPSADPNTPQESFTFKLELQNENGEPVDGLDFNASQYVEVKDPSQVKDETASHIPSLSKALSAAGDFLTGMFLPETAHAAPAGVATAPKFRGTSAECNYSWAFYDDGTLQVWQEGDIAVNYNDKSTGAVPGWIASGNVQPGDVKHLILGKEGLETTFELWDGMFADHVNLVDVRGANCCLRNIGQRAFKGCLKLGSFDLASFKLHSAVEAFDVGTEAFYEAPFSGDLVFTLEDPQQIVYFHSNAFYGSKVNSISVTNGKQVLVDSYSFAEMAELTELKFGSLKVEGRTYYDERFNDYGSMFLRCESLKEIDLSNWIFNPNPPDSPGDKLGADVDDMFFGCTSLWKVTGLPEGNRRIDSTSGMFGGCSSLKKLEWPGLVDVVWNPSGMFSGCTSLEFVDLSGMKVGNNNDPTYTGQIFDRCYGLKKVRLSPWWTFARDESFFTGFMWKRIDEASGKELGGPWTEKELADIYSDPENRGKLGGTYIVYADTTLSYDSGVVDGSVLGLPSTLHVDATLPQTVSNKVPSRFGYRFKGWKAPKQSKLLQPGDSIPVDEFRGKIQEGLTLVAQWERVAPPGDVEAGTYYFDVPAGWQLELSKVIPAGTTYRVSELTKDGWRLVASTGDTGIIEPAVNKIASFVNAPMPAGQATPAVVSLNVKKTLDGAPAVASSGFEFSVVEVADAQGAPLPGATVMKGQLLNDGKVIFAPVSFDAPGVYYYMISEQQPTVDDGVLYDSRRILATVTVHEYDGTLYAADRYSGGGGYFTDTFENVTKKGDLVVSKSATGVNGWAPDDNFTFLVTIAGKPYAGAYTVDGQSFTAASGKITLKGGQSATISGIVHGASYSVEEVDIPAGWTPSAAPANAKGVIDHKAPAEVAFANSYSASGVVMLEARKVLENGALKAGQFAFDVFACDEHGEPFGGPVATAHNDSPDVVPTIPGPDGAEVPNPEFGHAKVLFPDIVCGKPGTQRYAIVERVPANALNADGVRYDQATVDQKNAGGFARDGIVYDSVIRYADVSATDIGGTLDISVAYVDAAGNPLADGVVFTNRLEAVGLEITKRASNTTLSAAAREKAKFDLTLSLKDVDGAALKDVAYRIVNAGDDALISEGSVDDGRVVALGLDQRLVIGGLPYGAAYSVDEKQPAGWVADVPGTTAGVLDGSKQHELTSTYSAKGELVITALKRFDGKMTGGEFTFDVLDAADARKPIRTATNGADGAIAFKPFAFTEADHDATRGFLVVERPGSDDTVRYDDAVFTLEVKPADNGDGTMRIEPVIMDETGKRVTQILFVNGRQFKLPFTGGKGVGLAGVVVLALGCAAYLIDRRRKHA